MDPLLFIHGTGGDASTWDAVVPLLSARYRPIMMLEQPRAFCDAVIAADTAQPRSPAA